MATSPLPGPNNDYESSSSSSSHNENKQNSLSRPMAHSELSLTDVSLDHTTRSGGPESRRIPDDKTILGKCTNTDNNNNNSSNDNNYNTNDDNGKESQEDLSTFFWNTNLPRAQHTRTCPSFLQYALTNAKDRDILSTRDADYRRHTWQELREIAQKRRLDLLKRVPSELRKYREFTAEIERVYGSVMAFMVKERLGWDDEKRILGEDDSGTFSIPEGEGGLSEEGLFDDPDTYHILINDWPYGVDERVVHLVIWTKHAFATVPISSASPDGDLTPATRRAIDIFVRERFERECGSQNVLWFWNWSSLKSVLAVEHFHVMLFAPSEGFVDRVVTRRSGEIGARLS